MDVALRFEPTTRLEREETLDQGHELEAFLRDVEKRAFRIAAMMIRDADEALDIVQDAMIRLTMRYRDRPSAEWRPLFYRILKNRIRDWHRRRAVRNRVLSFFGGHDEDDADPMAAVPGPSEDNPLKRLEADESLAALSKALEQLPARQREAFMLRTFEGLDVAETAQAMECSEGSVKTHHSRAVNRLRELLGEQW
jgi:RNA polymerase sigma-70 factor (ECF subfamily)